MAYITIESGRLAAKICTTGAELVSLVDKATGHEYIWTGDPAVWSGHAPLLFPFIGKLNGGGYTLNGKFYPMGMHGFARKAEFAPERIKADFVSMCLPASSATLPSYPWRFRLWVTYSFENESLKMSYKVTNEDSKVMYFSIGGHPGFIAEKGDKLVFETNEALSVRRLDAATHLLKEGVFGEFSGEIPLSGALFADDAMIFKAPESEKATLVRQNGKNVSLSYGKVSYLGVWSRADENLKYVCIEPWHGVDDEWGFQGDVSQKEGIVALESGRRFELVMTITPEL